MTTIKKLALASAFAAFAVTGAQAAEEDTLFLLQNATENTPGVFTGTYPISNQGTDIDGFAVQSRIAGDTFVDDFILQLQDTQDVSFGVVSQFHFPKNSILWDVTFTSISLTDIFGVTTFIPTDSDFESHSASADWLGLGSGTYDLEFQGTINVKDGTYGGDLVTVPSVPEPTGWALMLAGLGAMGMLARRRKS